MKRSPFGWALFLLVISLLVACNQAPDALPVKIVSETATTRLVSHTFGETEIPVAPQRILAIGEEGLLADLLDIGAPLVGSTVNVTEAVPLITDEELEGIQLFATSTDTSIEELLSLEPDLIIGTVYFVNEIGYKRLSAIAPTVAVGGADALALYVETLTLFGLRPQAEQEVAAFREEIAAAAAQINSTQLTVSVGAVYVGPNVALFVDGPQAPPWLLSQLGVTMLPVGAEREALKVRNGRVFISEERWNLLSADHLILLQTENVPGEMEALAEISADPIWQQLPAVQTGNISVIDRLGYPGFRGQKALLQEFIERFD